MGSDQGRAKMGLLPQRAPIAMWWEEARCGAGEASGDDATRAACGPRERWCHHRAVLSCATTACSRGGSGHLRSAPWLQLESECPLSNVLSRWALRAGRRRTPRLPRAPASHLERPPPEDRSNELELPSPLEACAAIATRHAARNDAHARARAQPIRGPWRSRRSSPVALANEHRETAIKVNAVNPGFVSTDLNGHSGTMDARGRCEVRRDRELLEAAGTVAW
jgi:hypothetical protein